MTKGVKQLQKPANPQHVADTKLARRLIDLGYKALMMELQSDKAAKARLAKIRDQMKLDWR
jgi:hypothetical protein